MRPSALAFVLLVAFSLNVRSGAESLPSTFRVRDSQTAKKLAVDYFTDQGPDWVRKARPYPAVQAFVTRSPESVRPGLQRGDPIWVVDVVNEAESKVIQTSVGIVWVRAENGVVFLTVPKKI